MSKTSFKPGNMLYPLPVIMVTTKGTDRQGRERDNIFTVAWTGTVCSAPAMVSISVRKERYSYELLESNPEFVINLVPENLVFATDYCGVKSGRDEDKFAKLHLTRGKAETVKVPVIEESPVNIECRVTQVLELGSHDMFLAEVTNVLVDEAYIDENNRFDMNRIGLAAYSHGEYFSLGEKLGSFGYSVRKKK